MAVQHNGAGELEIAILSSFNRLRPPKLDDAELHLFSAAYEPRLGGGTHVALLTDGRELELGRLVRTESPNTCGLCTAHGVVTLPAKMLLQVAHSRRVQIRVGKIVSSLTDEQLLMLREMVNLPSAKPPATKASDSP